MKKTSLRFLSALSLLCAVFLLSILHSFAEETINGTTPDGFQYETSSQAATITGYEGDAAAITIPDKVEGVAVISIGESAFSGCSKLTSITIPTSVTTIGESAFSDCTSLTSITIPESVTVFGSSVFLGAPVTIHGHSKSIAFTYARENGLPFVYLDAVPLICEVLVTPKETETGETLTATWSLEDGNPPFKVTCTWYTYDSEGSQKHPEDEIEGTAYFVPTTGGWAYLVVDVVDDLGESHRFTSNHALVWAPSEQPVEYSQQMVEDKVNELAVACMAASGSEYDRAKWLHAWLTKNVKYDYTGTYGGPEGVLLAGKGICSSFATAYQLLLNKVGIANHYISGQTDNGTGGWGAHAWNLVQINGSWYHVDTTWDIGGGSRYFLKSDRTISANHRWDTGSFPTAPRDWGQTSDDAQTPTTGMTPEGLSYMYLFGNWGVTITGYAGAAAAVNIPHEVEGLPVNTIAAGAFANCSNLTTVTIPDSFASIGERAFENCSSLTTVNLPSGVTQIGKAAFSGCSNLTTINIPSGVANIGHEAFRNCTSLSSIDIPNGITSIGYAVFSGCSSLSSINIPDGVTSIQDVAFRGCSSLTSITLPSNTTSIGEWAFADCGSLSSINIPDGVTSIQDVAFRGCSSLTSITLPSNITSIGEWAFADCSSLSSINIPDGVTSIQDVAFRGCSSLTSITLPSNITSIGAWAFSNCSALTSINIPNSVTYIGEWAFAGCDNLKAITIPRNVTSLGEGAFGNAFRVTIYGYKNSAAHVFAWENNIPFVDLEAQDRLPGDVNGDGLVDEGDLESIIDFIILGLENPLIENADANEDGTVDILDVIWLIDKIIGD